VERGIKLATLPLRPSYWRSGIDSKKVELCYSRDACPQKNVTDGDLSSQCLDGHHGPICNICEPDYAKNLMGVCETCESKVNIPIETVVTFCTVVVSTLLFAYMLRRQKKKRDKQRKTMKIKSNFTRAARTKFKILASFVQIVSSYENVLDIRFPPMYEDFSRFISSIANLNALQLGSVDCFVSTSFYTKLLFSTLIPLIMCLCIYMYMVIAKCCSKSQARKRVIQNNCVELYFGLSFLVFASVSTTIFDTFNCKTFGDDPTRYLALDQSIDCDGSKHSFFTMYAIFMVLVYPVGIPLLYSYFLVSNRHQIQAKNRATNESLIKISFLWEMYEPGMWWFEIFECGRRLAMSGLLIFFSSGSPSQIVVGMMLSLGAIVIYVHCKPFLESDDDLLAVVSQLSIFFTLFGALLIRVQVDDRDGYDQAIFGVILIAVNSAGIVLVLSSIAIKPLQLLIRAMANHHRHEGTINGLTDEHDRNSSFIKYFEKLAMSTQHESGFTDILFDGPEWSTWLIKTKAKMEWRNSDGYGPINEGRVSFTIKRPVQYVKDYIVNPECEIRGGVLDHFVISTETPLREMSPKERLKAMAMRSRENRRVIYTGREVPFPLTNRDYLVEQFSHSSSVMSGAEVVVGRSIYEESLFSLKKSAARGFRRADVHIKGYFLTPSPSKMNNSTDVVFIAGVNGNMLFGALVAEKVARTGLRKVVDELQHLDHGERNEAKDNAGSKKSWGKGFKGISFNRAASGMGLADKDSMLEMQDLQAIEPTVALEGRGQRGAVVRRTHKYSSLHLRLRLLPVRSSPSPIPTPFLHQTTKMWKASAIAN
ncbi:hypothetical protein TrLO_g8011, partial [Triparma laevis f. longispina]